MSDALSLSSAFAGQGSFDGLRAICPHCGSLAVFQSMGSANMGHVLIDGYLASIFYQGRCPGCFGIALGVCLIVEDEAQHRLIWPHSVPPDRSPSGLDPEYKSIYDQARNVLDMSPMASAVLARRCLQHVIREKLGIKKKNLFDEIAEAVTRPELSTPTRSALDHVRKIGNWGAHPVEDQASAIIEVTQEDAEYTLQVLELLFQDLYAVPQQVATMQGKIQKKK